MKLSLQLAVITLVNVLSQALVYNEDDYKPWVQFCPPITPDPSLNMTWMASVDYWYIPVWSKRDLMLTVKIAQSSKEFSRLTDTNLQDSCFFYTGFKEKISTVDLHGLEKKLVTWTYSNRAMRGGVIDFFKNKEYEWTTYFVMTDNQHYVLGVDEFGDGTREFYLATTSDVVPSSHWDKIYKKIESYGFKKSQVYKTKNLCDDDAYLKKVKSGKA